MPWLLPARTAMTARHAHWVRDDARFGGESYRALCGALVREVDDGQAERCSRCQLERRRMKV